MLIAQGILNNAVPQLTAMPVWEPRPHEVTSQLQNVMKETDI